MIVTIQPTSIQGTITAPASKSVMQRCCAAALLHHGTTIISNAGKSNDDLAALDIIQKLGAKVSQEAEGRIVVFSEGVQPVSDEINCGESGLSLRMFTPIAALSNKQVKINGEGSLIKRPAEFFETIFPQLNISIQSKQGKLPLVIQGPLKPADIDIDGSISSQFLTGLLMAYSVAATKEVTIKVDNLKSKPYIDLTLNVMKAFGLALPANDNYEQFVFAGQSMSNKETIDYSVEGDWSGAAFLLVAAAIAGSVKIKGLDTTSAQADKAILQVLQQAGTELRFEDDLIQCSKAALKAFSFDATDCPDLFPPLVSLAAYCEGTSTIKGVSRLRHKESNRAKALEEEFRKMGVEIRFKDDIMVIEGGRGVKGATVHSHHDHRIAMACAVTALNADNAVVIEDADAVNKSYPEFFNHLSLLSLY